MAVKPLHCSSSVVLEEIQVNELCFSTARVVVYECERLAARAVEGVHRLSRDQKHRDGFDVVHLLFGENGQA